MGRNEKAFSIIMLCSIIGIIIAILLQFLYENSILVNELSASTLRKVQLVVVLLWEIFGIGVASVEA